MSIDILLRPARPEERPALEALQRRASLAWDDQREILLAHPDAIELPLTQITGGFVRVVERGLDIVGFCVVLPCPDGGAELDGLFVEPECWRTGIGRRLIDEAALMARSFGAGQLQVIANPRAVAFYEACGFNAQTETQTRFGPALRMVRKLVPGC